MPPRGPDLATENGVLREANEALRHEVGALSARVAEQEALREANEALRHDVEMLSARVADLEARLGQSSRNSSLPPSSDLPKSRAERRSAQREAAKAKGTEAKHARGKQPGAPGATLMRRSDPDEIVVREPERCDSCGKDLATAAAEGVASRQVYDTLDPMLVCTEHRSVKKRCSCGVLSAGGFPPEARAPVSYGPNVRAGALYLLHAQHCSVERTAQALSEMLGVPVSTGFVASLAAEAAGSLDPFLAEVAERLVASPIVHVDETPDQVRTDTVWFHVCATDLYTFLYASKTRGKAAPDQAGVLGRFAGTMVHDRLQMYFNYTKATHAICLAHVLRDLEAGGVRWNQGWATEMQTLLIETNNACHAARAKGKKCLARTALAAFLSTYDALVDAGLEANPAPIGRKRDYLEKKSYNIAVALRDRREEATRFASDLSIPFTNNEAESSLRMAKLHRKISGCFQGDDSAQHFAAIRSYIATARKHGVGALDVIARLFRGDVWMPPVTT
ncbi:MAG: IS66 family transposase [Steroidobacteraceae bacterium]